MPVAQPGAPKCPPFASLCECNKNHYYCLRIREERGKNSQGEVQAESIGHIQSAGCLGQSEVVTAAHNRCIRDLLRDIQTHTKKSSGLIMLTLESEQTIGKLLGAGGVWGNLPETGAVGGSEGNRDEHSAPEAGGRGTGSRTRLRGAVLETKAGWDSARQSREKVNQTNHLRGRNVWISKRGRLQPEHEAAGGGGE